MEPLEIITWNSTPLAYIIRGDKLPDQTTFLTPPEFNQRHVHRALERHLVGTSEVLVLQKGRCVMDIYNDQRELVATRELRTGDIMLMVGGGHGFRMLEDTVFLEVKQGPYTGVDEKQRF